MPEFGQEVQQNDERNLAEQQGGAAARQRMFDDSHPGIGEGHIEKNRGNGGNASLVCEFPLIGSGNTGQSVEINEGDIIVPPLRGPGISTGPGECHVELEVEVGPPRFDRSGPRDLPPKKPI